MIFGWLLDPTNTLADGRMNRRAPIFPLPPDNLFIYFFFLTALGLLFMFTAIRFPNRITYEKGFNQKDMETAPKFSRVRERVSSCNWINGHGTPRGSISCEGGRLSRRSLMTQPRPKLRLAV